ncbi:MAG: type II toxin-antitoxin system RelB/DinJ family antitoxin [Bacilli bacterium]|nr:type II toxin-antitoxin system RelB/DinJ family antitoxin [Bacilli bacterium]
MEAVNVTIRIDKKDRDMANELFKELGMTFNSAINTFVKQSLREQAIPFKVTKNNLSFLDDAESDKLTNNLIKKNLKAFKELAK